MKSAKEAIPNQELLRARANRGWSQQALADHVGTTPVNVSRWERGVTSPTPYFRQRLCAIFNACEQELGFGKPPINTKATDLDEPSLPEAPIQQLAVAAPTHTEAVEEPAPAIIEGSERTNKNRHRMIQRLTRWIGGFLAHSIYNETLLILGLQEQPEAVANPWRLTVQESELPARLLPPGVHITQVFDDSDHALLILGAFRE